MKTKDTDIARLLACEKMVDKQNKNDKQPNNSDKKEGNKGLSEISLVVNKTSS